MFQIGQDCFFSGDDLSLKFRNRKIQNLKSNYFDNLKSHCKSDCFDTRRSDSSFQDIARSQKKFQKSKNSICFENIKSL